MRRDEGAAIVTDAALRTALYTIRSLGRRGVRITAVERATPAAQNLGALSRYVTRRVTVPDNRREPDAFVDALLEVSAGHDVLVPIGMHSIEPVARRAAEFAGRLKTALAPWETIRAADHTGTLLDIARRLDIPHPKQFTLCDFPDLRALAAEVEFPAVVKTGVEAGLPPEERYRVVHGAEELVRAVRHMQAVTPAPLVQELVRGEGVGFEALYDFDGRLVAAFGHRRLREYPLSGGPSTYCESVHLPQAEAYGRRLLDHLRWAGLAMVEFKVDARTGVPKLMEVNPRPWGSMALPIRAGVDFPWLAYRLARDGRVPPQPDYPDGVRMRFLVNDVPAALAHARQAPSLARRLGILATLVDPRVHEGILSWRDPRPSWAYLLKGARRAFAKSAEPLT